MGCGMASARPGSICRSSASGRREHNGAGCALSRPGALLLCVKYQAAARIAVPAVFAANLLLPAAHVVYGFELPVRSFRQELAAWREPPNVVNAAFYVLQGRLLIGLRRLPLARHNFDNAIQLDPRTPTRTSVGEWQASKRSSSLPLRPTSARRCSCVRVGPTRNASEGSRAQEPAHARTPSGIWRWRSKGPARIGPTA